MSKLFGWIAIVVMILAGVWWWANRSGWIAKDYVLVSKPQSIEEIPLIDWVDIESGRLANYLMRQNELQTLPAFADGVEPLTNYKLYKKFDYDNRGFGYLDLFLQDIYDRKYAKPEARPYKLIGVFRTKIVRDVHYLLVYEWLDADNKVSFVPVVVPERLFVKDGKIGEYVSGMIEGTEKYFVSPVVKIRDMAGCMSIGTSSQEYCAWYMSRLDEYNKIFDAWLAEKRIPARLGNYPVLVTKININIYDK